MNATHYYLTPEGDRVEITQPEPSDLPGFVRAIRIRDRRRVLLDKPRVKPLETPPFDPGQAVIGGA